MVKGTNVLDNQKSLTNFDRKRQNSNRWTRQVRRMWPQITPWKSCGKPRQRACTFTRYYWRV